MTTKTVFVIEHHPNISPAAAVQDIALASQFHITKVDVWLPDVENTDDVLKNHFTKVGEFSGTVR